MTSKQSARGECRVIRLRDANSADNTSYAQTFDFALSRRTCLSMPGRIKRVIAS